MRQWLSTKEKCILRDLIKLEIRSLDRDDYGKYKYFPFEYAEQLLKLGNKLQLDEQQKVKANKLYRKDRI
jgi:hypothetical protein|tara:strand:+ start:312 stop:521 length:210 start_codon:yes stop_codon:yes gene_type:complete